MPQREPRTIIIGAGPAGLTAAYKLCKAGLKSVVLEKDDVVGGISRTVKHKGYHFDIGGHRFFTKVKAVDEMWHEVLISGEFLRRNRLSRIYYNKKFFQYPIEPLNALLGLGLWNSFLVFLSYLRAKIRPTLPAETLEQYLINHFGKRLYQTFFKTYTEKVWGLPCHEISAEWGAQRIRGLSLKTALKTALLKPEINTEDDEIKSLIKQFHYPQQGPGMMWEKVAGIVSANGCELRMGVDVSRILVRDGEVQAVEIASHGQHSLISGSHFISSMPLQELVQKIDPPVTKEVLDAAQRLNYRDFLTVTLIINKINIFPDNWVYIHDSGASVGRIQNFKNWSPKMVPDQNKTSLGMEYFCFEGDGLWSMPDQELIELAKSELVSLGLVEAQDIEDGVVVRMPKAYPVYDSGYAEALKKLRDFLGGIRNLQVVGRNGMHKYNNQDHSMLTAMLAVENIQGAHHDLWVVNADEEYHEEKRSSDEVNEFKLLASTQPGVPKRRALDSS